MYNIKNSEATTKSWDMAGLMINLKAELTSPPADAEAFAPELPEALADLVACCVVVADAIELDKDVATL